MIAFMELKTKKNIQETEERYIKNKIKEQRKIWFVAIFT